MGKWLTSTVQYLVTVNRQANKTLWDTEWKEECTSKLSQKFHYTKWSEVFIFAWVTTRFWNYFLKASLYFCRVNAFLTYPCIYVFSSTLTWVKHGDNKWGMFYLLDFYKPGCYQKSREDWIPPPILFHYCFNIPVSIGVSSLWILIRAVDFWRSRRGYLCLLALTLQH